jgi:hypothetical protein
MALNKWLSNDNQQNYLNIGTCYDCILQRHIPIYLTWIDNMNIDLFRPTIEWIKDDFKSNRIRFAVELLAWAISIGCSITMALTVPTPPLLALYPVWILGCALYAWASWTRKSFGMLANYILLTTIDSVGLIRMLAA